MGRKGHLVVNFKKSHALPWGKWRRETEDTGSRQERKERRGGGIRWNHQQREINPRAETGGGFTRPAFFRSGQGKNTGGDEPA